MTANQLLSPVMNKEIRAIAPGWLACLASFGIAALVAAGRFRGLVIPVHFFGAITLGALSMGHEYTGGTLTLLLSQPRRREHLFLLKLGVLAVMLLTLAAVARVALFNASGAVGLPAMFGFRAEDWQGLVLVLPLLCGLFIAPWLTMLCRNPLAGIVFTVAATGVVMLVSDVSAAVKYGSDPTTASGAIALKVAIIWRGMLAISAIAAISSWRLFMRLEAVDDRGQAVRLPWLRSRTTTIATVPVFAKRHPLWLLAKKELRLQQLSFVVAGLYVIGWFGIWSVSRWIPGSHEAFLDALTAINGVAAALLAGSLASAEERQLGTLEWHTLLPMSARTQWTVKAGIAVVVAGVLSLGVPALLSALTRSSETRAGVSPLVLAAAGCALFFLTVASLYVSSLCTSGVRALLWSVLMGLGGMAFVSRWVIVQFGVAPFFTLFNTLRWWRELGARPFVLLIVLNALSLAMYAGGLGLLLRFARVNHHSADRGFRRISNQLFRLGAFLALVMSLWFGVSQIFYADMRERSRVAMQKTRGTLTGGAVDNANRPVTSDTLDARGGRFENAQPDTLDVLSAAKPNGWWTSRFRRRGSQRIMPVLSSASVLRIRSK